MEEINIKRQILAEHFNLDVEDVEYISNNVFSCLTEGKYCILNDSEAEDVLESYIEDLIKSEKSQVRYDLEKYNLEYILEYLDIETYYDSLNYDLDDFEWEHIDSYDYGSFFILRV